MNILDRQQRCIKLIDDNRVNKAVPPIRFIYFGPQPSPSLWPSIVNSKRTNGSIVYIIVTYSNIDTFASIATITIVNIHPY